MPATVANQVCEKGMLVFSASMEPGLRKGHARLLMLSSSIERAPVPVPGMIGLDQVASEAPDLSSRIVCSAIAKLLQAWGESVGGALT